MRGIQTDKSQIDSNEKKKSILIERRGEEYEPIPVWTTILSLEHS